MRGRAILARNAGRNALLVAMALAMILIAPAAAQGDVSSAFSTDDEGWRVVGNDPFDPSAPVSYTHLTLPTILRV